MRIPQMKLQARVLKLSQVFLPTCLSCQRLTRRDLGHHAGILVSDWGLVNCGSKQPSVPVIGVVLFALLELPGLFAAGL